MYDVDPQRPVLRLGDGSGHTQPTLVLKNCQTGELLGPSAPFWPPSRVVYAVRHGDGWKEVEEPKTSPSTGLTTSELLALAERQMEEAIKRWSSAYMDWTRKRKHAQPIASAQTLSLQDAIDRHVTYSERKKAQSVSDSMMRYR